MNFFAGLKLARECMLALCMHCVVVQRIRFMPDSVIVEIDRPLEVEGDIETKNGYAAIAFGGCTLAWKVPEGN